VHPAVDAEYVARMEDVLGLYAEKSDLKRPGCVLRREARPNSSAKCASPSQLRRAGLERFATIQTKTGLRTSSCFLDVHEPWRHVK